MACSPFARFFCSSIGKKVLVALTGIGLVGFLVIHMAGHLLVLKGAEAYNAYAAGLKSNALVLWGARGGLLAIFVIHIWKALTSAVQNQKARPQKYAMMKNIQLTFASRTMVQTGLLILLFVLYHLAHFTLHLVHNTGERFDAAGHADVFYMFVVGFQNPIILVLYIAAMAVLGLHISHGISSLLQTLGINHPKYQRALRLVGPVLGWLIILGFIVPPVAVMMGVVNLSGTGA